MTKSRSASIEANFFDKYRQPTVLGLPKYAQLQQAILAAINDGFWKPGAKLPTEVQLTQITPFSLGTVQKAVHTLGREGRIVRLRGRGTFVANRRKGFDEPVVHVHFINDDGTDYLPLFPKIITRKRIAETGPWSSHLGQRGDNILRIERSFNVNDEFLVFSQFYLNADRFGSFMQKPISRLNGANFKLILEKEFNLSAIFFSQRLMLRKFPPAVCEAIKIRNGVTGLVISVVASARGPDPVYYQDLFIPPNRRGLQFPDIAYAVR